MEFKVRLTRKQKSRSAIHKKDSGYRRVKIRGRKRWLKVEKKSASAVKPSAPVKSAPAAKPAATAKVPAAKRK